MNDNFDKLKHIEKMRPYTDRLLNYLKSKNIEFIETDGDMENVVLRHKDRQLKIAHKCFYRFSGICCIHRDGKEKNSIEIVDIDDDVFMNSYMRSIIDYNFK